MMTFMPVALAATGRWAFWPRKPKVDHAADLTTHGMWGKNAEAVGRQDSPLWIGAALLLIILFAAGIGSFQTDDLPHTARFIKRTDPGLGTELYAKKFERT